VYFLLYSHGILVDNPAEMNRYSFGNRQKAKAKVGREIRNIIKLQFFIILRRLIQLPCLLKNAFAHYEHLGRRTNVA